MRKAICTIAQGPHRALLDVTRPRLEEYARRHGYDLVVPDHRVAPHRPASWGKVFLLHALVQRYDLVVWIDADAIVVDLERDVADVLRPRRFLHLVEHQVPDGRVPNCGVLVFRGGDVSRAFLGRVWNAHEHVHHKWWENAAVLRLLGYRITPPVAQVRLSPWRLGVGFLDRAWNSIPHDPAPDPVIIHLPGLSHEERIARLRALA